MAHPQSHAARRLMGIQSLHRQYQDGGQVRGPGTGTSDSIPARLSDGEFVLPADTVRKVGVKSLRDLVHATHAPVKAKSGRHNYANGDLVTTDDQKRPNSFGDAAAAASNPGVTQVQTAPAPAAPQSTAARMAALPGAAPAAAQPDPVAAHNQKLVAAQELQSWQQAQSTSASPADSQAARKNYLELQQKSVDMQPSYFTQEGPMTAKNRAAAESAASNALQSMYAPQKPAPTSTTAQSAGERMATLPGYGHYNQGQNMGPPDLSKLPDTGRSPVGDTVVFGNQPTSDIKREGNSYSGTNVSGDITINGQAPRNGGQVSTENMAAADALGTRSAVEAMMARLSSAPGVVPREVQAPTVAHSGNSWSAQNALRNAQVSASSIMNNGGSWDKHKGVSPERAYAAAMENADFAARGAQPGMEQAAMRENAAIQREGMQQAGSTARARLMEAGQNNRFGQTQGLARDKFGLEQTAAGYQNRGAQRIEKAQQDLEAAGDNPAKQRSARQRLLGLMGKQDDDAWQGIALQGATDAHGNKTEGVLAALNKRTGDVRRLDQGAQPPSAAPAEGTRVRGKDGKMYVVKDGKPVLVGG